VTGTVSWTKVAVIGGSGEEEKVSGIIFQRVAGRISILRGPKRNLLA